MADESLEGFRLAGEESAREFGLAWLVHAPIVTWFGAQPERRPSGGRLTLEEMEAGRASGAAWQAARDPMVTEAESNPGRGVRGYNQGG
jgi:hypothetical protein